MVWKTRKDFDRDLSQSYRSSKFGFGEKRLGAALLRSKQRKRNRPPKEVAEGLSILDDLALDAIFWVHSLAIRVFQSRSLNRRQNFKRSIFALLLKISQDAMVIRNLMAAGYDVQARNLLRSVDEHVDALYYLCLRPDACDEFVLTNDSESANHFWWKHIRRARAVIDSEIKRRLGRDHYQELSDYKSEERKMFSSAHHPSYVASTVPFLVPYDTVSVFDYLFGVPNEYSYRTGRFLFFILAEISMMVGFLDADLHRLIGSRARGPLQEYIKKGQTHLLQMLLALSKNRDGPLFSNSGSMTKYLSGLPG